MPKYIMERRIPSAGQMSPSDLHSIAAKSNSILSDIQTSGKQVQWIESFVLDDAIHCVYNAASADLIREHAECGGFPADAIYEVPSTIDPTTGE